MEFPHPLMVCDIGGTNTRIGSVDVPGSEPMLLAKVKTADYSGFVECVEDVLGATGAPAPKSIIACGAGPVAQRHLQLTNANWRIDGPQVAYRLGLSQGLLLNDFEAQALSIPTHRAHWLHIVGEPLVPDPGPRLILGPGTGLGLAALIGEGQRYLPLASEAAHTDFAAVTPDDLAIWPELEKSNGRITAETLVSGPGLARLHRARERADPAAAGLTPAEIVARALGEPGGAEARTVGHFWRLVGRFAGDMALAFLARGGVFLSGGILPRIVPLLEPAAFRASFEDKAPMSWVVRRIPVAIVMAPDAVLAGMAAVGGNPQRYQINYEDRAWR